MVVVEEKGLTNADTTADEEVSRAAMEVKNFMVCWFAWQVLDCELRRGDDVDVDR